MRCLPTTQPALADLEVGGGRDGVGCCDGQCSQNHSHGHSLPPTPPPLACVGVCHPAIHEVVQNLRLVKPVYQACGPKNSSAHSGRNKNDKVAVASRLCGCIASGPASEKQVNKQGQPGAAGGWLVGEGVPGAVAVGWRRAGLAGGGGMMPGELSGGLPAAGGHMLQPPLLLPSKAGTRPWLPPSHTTRRRPHHAPMPAAPRPPSPPAPIATRPTPPVRRAITTKKGHPQLTPNIHTWPQPGQAHFVPQPPAPAHPPSPVWRAISLMVV